MSLEKEKEAYTEFKRAIRKIQSKYDQESTYCLRELTTAYDTGDAKLAVKALNTLERLRKQWEKDTQNDRDTYFTKVGINNSTI